MTTDGKNRVVSEEQEDYLLQSEYTHSGMDKLKVLVVEDDLTTRLLYEKGLFNQIFDKKWSFRARKHCLFMMNGIPI